MKQIAGDIIHPVKIAIINEVAKTNYLFFGGLTQFEEKAENRQKKVLIIM